MSLEIKDIGIILALQKYGESSLLIKIISKEHGVCKGFVKGAIKNGKHNSTYQIGNLVDFSWRAKNPDNLGYFKIELEKSFLSKIIFDKMKLYCITAIVKVISDNILEREPHQELFDKLQDLLQNISKNNIEFLAQYIKMELYLLQILGYGLDLSYCALTGSSQNLYFVSPKTGRAATREAGLKYQDKLLKIPQFLVDKNHHKVTDHDISLGLNLSGFFLQKYLGDNVEFFEIRQKILN